MDLRKAILMKKPLQEASFSSLNNSGLSIYESAAEDSDSDSMYFSFSNNSEGNLDSSATENESSLVDKENTVIMKDFEDVQNKTFKEQQVKLEEEEKMDVDTSPIKEIVQNIKAEAVEIPESHVEAEKVSDVDPLPEVSNVQSNSIVIPQIIVEDPNENLVNPFTFTATAMPVKIEEEEIPETIENRMSIETDNVTKRKIQEVCKKSASKIPTRTHLYSPVQRRSLDKKSKVITRPTSRRTVYETRSMTVKPKTPVIPPVQTKVTLPKPPMHKCTFSGCRCEFRTLKALQDHQKIHPTSSSASARIHSSFKCKWCDKVFELNTALNSHMLDKCPKIPVTEKRKLLAQQDKKAAEVSNKRKSVFVAPPVPRKRSPRRQTMNMSGVIKTPKKTLKCGNEGCNQVFKDALSYANHLVAHKYEGVISTQGK